MLVSWGMHGALSSVFTGESVLPASDGEGGVGGSLRGNRGPGDFCRYVYVRNTEYGNIRNIPYSTPRYRHDINTGYSVWYGK